MYQFSMIAHLSIMDYFDTICYQCIDIMQRMSAITGISYGAINTILFVILNPSLIGIFAVSALLGIFNRKKLSIAFFIVGSVYAIFAIGLIVYSLCQL